LSKEVTVDLYRADHLERLLRLLLLLLLLLLLRISS
jgi:hypothetical protein